MAAFCEKDAAQTDARSSTCHAARLLSSPPTVARETVHGWQDERHRQIGMLRTGAADSVNHEVVERLCQLGRDDHPAQPVARHAPAIIQTARHIIPCRNV